MFMKRDDSKMESSPVVISEDEVFIREDDDEDDTTIAPPTVNRNIASALSNAGARQAEHSPHRARATPVVNPAPRKDMMTAAEATAAVTKSNSQKDYESTVYGKALANYDGL